MHEYNPRSNSVKTPFLSYSFQEYTRSDWGRLLCTAEGGPWSQTFLEVNPVQSLEVGPRKWPSFVTYRDSLSWPYGGLVPCLRRLGPGSVWFGIWADGQILGSQGGEIARSMENVNKKYQSQILQRASFIWYITRSSVNCKTLCQVEVSYTVQVIEIVVYLHKLNQYWTHFDRPGFDAGHLLKQDSSTQLIVNKWNVCNQVGHYIGTNWSCVIVSSLKWKCWGIHHMTVWIWPIWSAGSWPDVGGNPLPILLGFFSDKYWR